MNDIITLLFLAVGLSMDAFAVSICKGLCLSRINMRSSLIVGAWFGGFQALMPLIGYYCGQAFHHLITQVDHWVAFGLLLLIGCNMIKEAIEKHKTFRDTATHFTCDAANSKNPLGVKTMFVMAVATSIDALAVGLSLAMAETAGFNIWTSVLAIGIVTALLSMLGLKVGALFGHRYEAKAEFVGGIILIGIGIRVLIEHLF